MTDTPGTPGPAGRMLGLATAGFLVNFWAWALISPLGAAYRDDLDLSAFQQAFLVAVPVVVGSVGRIPVGALTDRLGARVMFPAVSALTILPVMFVGLFADTYALLIAGGFFLGLGGTTFAVGVPLVNAWFPPQRGGLALGIFGVGMGGTAISAFTTVRPAEGYGRAAPFLLVAGVLAAYSVVASIWLRDAPGRASPQESFLARTVANVIGHYDYREGTSVWFRGIFRFDLDPELMAAAPLSFQAHSLTAFLLFALWPFTRLVHAFSAPIGYLWRPYVVYRSKDERLGARAPARGWERVGDKSRR